MKEIEEWRTARYICHRTGIIEVFPMYLVSNLGRIKRIGRTKSAKGSINDDGYIYMALQRADKTYRRCYLHRVIASTFLPYPPHYSYEANHIDENKLNCAASNLNWLTNGQNNNYGTRLERASKSLTNRKDISKPVKVTFPDKSSTMYPSAAEAARTLGFRADYVRNIINYYNGHYKKLGLFFEYV